MFDLKDLYQEVIVDHNRSPRNFGKPAGADTSLEGFNPLCGDRLTLYLRLADEKIEDIGFDGNGCAISVASASLMTEVMKGKLIAEAEALFAGFHELLTGAEADIDLDKMGKLAALAGVRAYPSRIKCATLCWHTLNAAMHGEAEPVTTE